VFTCAASASLVFFAAPDQLAISFRLNTGAAEINQTSCHRVARARRLNWHKVRANSRLCVTYKGRLALCVGTHWQARAEKPLDRFCSQKPAASTPRGTAIAQPPQYFNKSPRKAGEFDTCAM